jgi:hypothetical protein
LAAGALVVSVKQQHEDKTQIWASDINVTVSATHVNSPVLLSPVANDTVETASWVEGIATPGVEIRVVKVSVPATIYGQGVVPENGRWRIQLQSNLQAGNGQTISVGAYVGGVLKIWMLPNTLIDVVAATTVSSPTTGATVQVQPWLIGTGSPRGQVSVFDGSEGPLLGRTVVDDDGNWRLLVAEPMTAGAHVLSVKQRREDMTQIWPVDINVTVDANFVDTVKILTFASGATVKAGSWVEGLGLPGVEVRIVKGGAAGTIYARGLVGSNGRWRVQFLPTLPVGLNNSINAAFYVNADAPATTPKSAWLSAAFSINVVADN